ncbi:hypothetical protein NBRC116595_28310 [Aliiglaciecola sp. NS0011-25]
MHLRESGELNFHKKGRAFKYELPSHISLLQHPLGEQLLNWHHESHSSDIPNIPRAIETKRFLEYLIAEILIPVERQFGNIKITYGFTSKELARYIAKFSPQGTAPKLDQHAGCEINSNENTVSKRSGCACDFIVSNYSMIEVTRYIVKTLNFDRLYFYGEQRPIHVSVNDAPVKHLQVMGESKLGRRHPSKKAFGEAAIKLAEEL